MNCMVLTAISCSIIQIHILQKSEGATASYEVCYPLQGIAGLCNVITRLVVLYISRMSGRRGYKPPQFTTVSGDMLHLPLMVKFTMLPIHLYGQLTSRRGGLWKLPTTTLRVLTQC